MSGYAARALENQARSELNLPGNSSAHAIPEIDRIKTATRLNIARTPFITWKQRRGCQKYTRRTTRDQTKFT
jgi:hypothetical protein